MNEPQTRGLSPAENVKTQKAGGTAVLPGLRIVCYNILDGGLGRLDPIYETLLYLDGDVVGLCEADDPAGVRYLAEKLGMDFVIAEGPATRKVALLSRRPILQMVNLSVKHEILDQGAMEAVVEVEGSELRIVLAHLAAGQYAEDEKRRMEQVQALLGSLEQPSPTPGLSRGSGASDTLPTLLMGDLNAAASYHPFDYEQASPSIKRRLAERGAGELDHEVIGHLCNMGWVDAYHKVRPDGAKQTFTTGFPCSRFDYIWANASLAARLVDADVEQGGFAPYCSDHYPVWATFRV